MKKYITLVLAAGFALSASAATIKDTKELSNTAVYTLNRQAPTGSGNGVLHADVDGGKQIFASTSSKLKDDNAALKYWSIHYSETEKAYYLYNISTGKFATGNKLNQAILGDDAVTFVPVWDDSYSWWMLDCGGYFIGLDDSYNGKAFFADDFASKTDAKNCAAYFTISSDDAETLTAEQVAEIEAKVLAGRAAQIAKYQQFIEDAKNVKSTASITGYLGAYDYEALENALANVDNYALSELEELYQAAILSRYPKEGHYYRLHNRTRPAAYTSNQLGLNSSNQVVSRTLKTPAFGTAASGYAEDLCLVRFWPVGGDPTQVNIEIPAVHKFLTNANANSKPGLTASRSDAYVYTIETVSAKDRYYRFNQPDKSLWLTISGSNELVGYGTAENPMHFYIEPVDVISIPLDANGYATVCLPCGIELPEGVKAYTVTDFAGGKAYVEEVASPVHQSTPVIIKGTGATAELIVKNNTNWANTAMAGNTVVNNEAPGRYEPTYSANGIGFKYVAEGKAMPGSAYIVSDNIGDVTTVMGANPEAGIEEISADQADAYQLHDLQGRPVAGKPAPGIYINAATRRAIRLN